MISLEEINKLELKAEEFDTPELWQQVILGLEKRYKNDPEELETVLRLGFLYWFLVLEHGIYNYNLDPDELENSLKKLYRHSKNKFSKNVEYLWMFSYIIEIAAYQFDEENEEAEKMRLKALQLDSNNPFIYLMKPEKYSSDDNYKKICEKAKFLIIDKKYFDNRGILGRYFKPVFENRANEGCSG